MKRRFAFAIAVACAAGTAFAQQASPIVYPANPNASQAAAPASTDVVIAQGVSQINQRLIAIQAELATARPAAPVDVNKFCVWDDRTYSEGAVVNGQMCKRYNPNTPLSWN